MTYYQIYEHLLKEARKKIKIYHRPVRSDLDGFFEANLEYIVINTSLKNTKRGVHVLAHELAHFNDKKSNKFKLFFRLNREKYTKKKMSEVIKAERSAGRGAKKMCAKYGKLYSPEELNPKILPNLIKFWRKFYFCD